MSENLDARLNTGLAGHPKTKKLIRRLGPAAAWSFVCLILWARANKPDGDLSGMTDEEIELAADWNGDLDVLVATLADVRFIDGEAGNRHLHDWADHQPWANGAEMRSAKARWNAIKRYHGADEADRQVPEWASARKSAGADSMNNDAASNAGSTEPADKQRALSNAPSPSPSPSPSEKSARAACAAPGTVPVSSNSAEPIFGFGLGFLVSKGISGKAARSFLGLMRKTVGDEVAFELLERAERDDVSDPVPWLRKAMEARKDKPARPYRTGMVSAGPKDYSEGVRADGSF